MKLARALLIFSYGAFTIAAQTLIFREFITSFEGTDISVGIFFSSWFLWVGLGAQVVYRAKSFADRLLANFELAFLLFLPAFVLQFILIVQARELAGIESYTLLPIRTTLVLAMIVNAPISILTGMFFPVGCRWITREPHLPVSRVYILEAAGSFVGGLGVTVLLAYGVGSAAIFFVLALFILIPPLVVALPGLRPGGAGQRSEYHCAVAALCSLLLLCILICLGADVDAALMTRIRTAKWNRLFPGHAPTGSFRTAQAEYLYGFYDNQWIAVREGSVCEALPDEATAGRIAALSLCQNPHTRRILVVGSGLGLCRQLLRLPQIEHVTWSHCDSEYVRAVNKFIPDRLRIDDRRFAPLAGDVRPLLAQNEDYYDLAILNLPDATDSVLNRYYTLEFYGLLKRSLRTGGVVAARVAGGENIMGSELVNLGASTRLTLSKVFSQLVLTPGEDTWFIASDREDLTGEPGTLQDRYAAIEGAKTVFAPQGLFSVYLPDRAELAMENYSNADLPERLLVNRDVRPLAHLYSLLLSAKQSGAPVTRFVKHLALAPTVALLVPLIVFAVLRILYLLRTNYQGRVSGFDSTFLIFSAGWVGIGVVIVLMYLYQTHFGSLYLHIGVISSLFMIGMTAGAIGTRRLLVHAKISQTPKLRWQVILFAVIVLHAAVLAAVAFQPVEQSTHLFFAIAFVLAGLCGGCYFPLAAAHLAEIGLDSGPAGSKLETADHLGAAVGGLVTALLLVPVLGARVTILVFILFMLVNVPAAVIAALMPEKLSLPDTLTFRLRRLGYVLFGLCASIVLCSNLLAAAGRELSPLLPKNSAQALAGRLELRKTAAPLEGANSAEYFELYDETGELNGYIFSSEALAPEVRGFGGTMNMAVYVDASGKLIDFHIIRSNETPAYLELLTAWRRLLSGHNLFGPQPFAGLDTVTGATVSCDAILSALQSSGQRFARTVLGRDILATPAAATTGFIRDSAGVYLAAAFLITFIVIYRGGFWSRLFVLVLNLVIGGLVFNTQYSSEQIATLLSFQLPAPQLSAAFLLVAAVPFVVLLFGNVYCGYLCPFGAAQELLGHIVPRKFKPTVSTEQMQNARFVKYMVLVVLIVVFFSLRNRTTLAADPLIEVFSLHFSARYLKSTILPILLLALLASLFYTRFWCRYLCPVGAFLSLFNNLAVLKRFMPLKKFGKCEFGVTARDQADCIYCDRCRHITPPSKPHTSHTTAGKVLIASAILMAVVVSSVSLNRFVQLIPSGIDHSPVAAASGGEPRNVDVERVEKMIREGQLSGREAEFYKKVE